MLLPSLDDIAVVIRSCGERTVPLLLSSMKNLSPNAEIKLLEVAPFFDAVVATYPVSQITFRMTHLRS